MSLKARIEAVIYAAEEPVTLAQLATLFRDDALAERAGPPADAAEPQPEPEAPDPHLLAAEPEAPLAAAAETEAPPPDPGAADGPAAADDPGAVDDPRKAGRQLDREAREILRDLVDELIADYNAADRGLEIREVAGGYRMATRAEYHDAVRAFIRTLRPPMKLSLQALETLAVIAYKQPVTAPEIGEIRGVDSAGVLGSLVARKLITTAGRKQVIGRPILYKTTREFLLRFGLKDLNELPSIEEFEKMAGELAESSDEAAAIAPGEEELPFAQNEIAAVEDAEPAPEAEAEPDPAAEPAPEAAAEPDSNRA